MEAARAEEGEPPYGAFALNIRTLTGGTTTLRDVVCSQTVHAVTLRLCVEMGGEPTLTRLLHEQKPLADRKRSLQHYGIVGDAASMVRQGRNGRAWEHGAQPSSCEIADRRRPKKLGSEGEGLRARV